MLVSPSGARLWRLRYRFSGREAMIALGSYPATSLREARERRDGARKQIEAGLNPSSLRVEARGTHESLVLFVLALRALGTARTGAYFSTAPFMGAVLAIAMLHESLSVRLIVAGALMVVGVYLHVIEAHEHEHAHELLEHEHRHGHKE